MQHAVLITATIEHCSNVPILPIQYAVHTLDLCEKCKTIYIQNVAVEFLTNEK